MTSDEIARLRALAEKATPGPWERMNATDVFTASGVEAADGRRASRNDGWQVADCQCGLTFLPDGEQAELKPAEQIANAEWIAAARDALPRALDEIERLRSVLMVIASKAEGEAELCRATGTDVPMLDDIAAEARRALEASNDR